MSIYSDAELRQTEVFKMAERQCNRVANSPLPPRHAQIVGLESDPGPSKPQDDSTRRELDRVARQLEGMSKALKRLKDTL